MNSDYAMAWGWYLVSAIALMLVVWRMSSVIRIKDLRTVLRVLALAVLFTPAQLEVGSSYWAPAFMAALIDTVTISTEAGLSRLWLLLLVMFVLVVLSFLWRIKRYKRCKAISEPSPES